MSDASAAGAIGHPQLQAHLAALGRLPGLQGLHSPGEYLAAAAAAAGAAALAGQPVVTRHLRCQMTQNQSMSGELHKAMRRITPGLLVSVSQSVG